MIELNEEFADKLKEACERRHAWDFYGRIRRFFPVMHSIRRELGHRPRVDIAKVNYSLKEMKNKAFLFYKDLRPAFYENIKKVLNAPDTILREAEPSEKHGSMAVGLSGKGQKRKIEVDLHPFNDVQGMVSVAHEFAHILSERAQKGIGQKTDCIGEIESLFIEKLYLDYLLKNGVISKEEYDRNKEFRKNGLACDLGTIFEEEEILSRLGRDINKEALLKLDNDTKDHRNHDALMHRLDVMVNGKDGREFHGEYVFRYVVGEVVAEALYQDYLKQPKETLENFERFLQNNAHLSLQGSLDTLLGKNAEKKIGDAWLSKSKTNEK